MKPLLARRRLEQVAQHLARAEPLPPLLSGWLGLAIMQRMQNADSSLDQLLGLRSRQGGRLSACSQQPARDAALRELAGEAGTAKGRATALQARIRAWQAGATDEDLDTIARRYGDPPSSLRQLQRIVGGRTEAARIGADDGNPPIDMSSRTPAAGWQHHPTRGPCNEPEHPHHAR
jgi:uncharacterized protein YbjQ (UPF0145 family)